MKFHFVVNIGLLVLNQNAEFLTIDRVNQNEYKIISFMLPLVNKTLDILFVSFSYFILFLFMTKN